MYAGTARHQYSLLSPEPPKCGPDANLFGECREAKARAQAIADQFEKHFKRK
jgi:hypothetical protein